MITPVTSKCLNGSRHLFSYQYEPGTSAPVCQRLGCGKKNPRYAKERDPYADQ